eukprot:353038-Chlamydomonas_euryale.AAC.3
MAAAGPDGGRWRLGAGGGRRGRRHARHGAARAGFFRRARAAAARCGRAATLLFVAPPLPPPWADLHAAHLLQAML